MFRKILVPVDLADTDLAKSAIETAVSLANASGGAVRLMNVLPITPAMLAKYVPSDFDARQRQSHEVLEEAKSIHADLIVVSSHLPAMKSYFLGSNAGHVVRFAKCSVLVVRHTQ